MQKKAIFLETITKIKRETVLGHLPLLLGSTGIVENFQIFGKESIHLLIGLEAGEMPSLLDKLRHCNLFYIERENDFFNLGKNHFEQKKEEVELHLTIRFYFEKKQFFEPDDEK